MANSDSSRHSVVRSYSIAGLAKDPTDASGLVTEVIVTLVTNLVRQVWRLRRLIAPGTRPRFSSEPGLWPALPAAGGDVRQATQRSGGGGLLIVVAQPPERAQHVHRAAGAEVADERKAHRPAGPGPHPSVLDPQQGRRPLRG